MILLLSAVWPGLLGAVVIGCVVGLWCGWPESRAVLPCLIGLALVLMLLAALRALPGLPGFWLEGAALMLPLYLVGCALGTLGNRRPGAGR